MLYYKKYLYFHAMVKKEKLRNTSKKTKQEHFFETYKKYFRYDLVAGITVALVMIPQSMAYAGLAGLPMQMGLYTALFGLLLASIFGSSKQMISGPVTIVSIMTGSAIGSLGVTSESEAIIYASILALLVGLLYLLLRIFRLGFIVDFLSHPVVIGFTNAIALVTIFSQLSKIFGVSPEKWSHYFETLILLFSEIINNPHLPSLVLGVWGIVFLLSMRYLFPKLPRVLILIVGATLGSYYFGFQEIYGGKIVGEIPTGLPNLIHIGTISSVSFEHIIQLIPFAIMIAIIGFTESISVAKIVSIKTKQKINPNREIIGQAIANLGSGLFWGYPIAGSFSRTAVNLKNNAKTDLSSLIAGIIVALTLIFFTPYLYYIPIAVLAAIIIVAVGGLIKVDPIIEAYKIQKHDWYIAILTFLLTIILTPNVEIALAVGVILCLADYIYKNMRPKIVEVSYYKTGVLRNADFFGLRTSRDISFYKVDANLFFGNSSYFERIVLNMITEKPKIKVVVFDFEWMSNIDSSAFSMFENLVTKLKSQKIRVYMCGLRTKVIYKMDQVGYLQKFSRDHIFEKTHHVIEYLKDMYKKEELDLSPLLEYTPIHEEFTKESEEIMEKITQIDTKWDLLDLKKDFENREEEEKHKKRKKKKKS